MITAISLANSGGRVRAETRALGCMRHRLIIVAAAFSLAFAAIALRLSLVALQPEDATIAAVPSAAAVPSPIRAPILDRNGVVLATTLPSVSAYIRPELVLQPDAAATAIAQVLPTLGRGEVLRRLTAEKPFVYLQRDISPATHKALNDLGIPAIGFEDGAKRIYPAGRQFAHLVGFTGIDGDGLAGLEHAFDGALRRGEAPLTLSLDSRLQFVLREELLAGIAEFQAQAAAGVIKNIATGEVLAAVSLPDFDPYAPQAATDAARLNRISHGVYELGSVFKVFAAALALDTGLVRADDAFDAREPLTAGRFAIRDYRPQRRWLTVPEIVVHSSNIGAAQLAMVVGPDTQRDFLERLGMTTSLPLPLGESGRPLLPRRWGAVSAMTIAYGHGISVTPLHVTSALASIIGDGRPVRPTLLRRQQEAAEWPQAEPAPRIVSPETSQTMRRMLRMVTAHSQAKDADPTGYRLGGKTGTALKPIAGGYSDTARIASFVGAFPIDAPRYALFVMVDEPQGHKGTHGFATGGWVAAPIVGRVVQRMAPIVGIAPQSDWQDDGFALPLQPGGWMVRAADETEGFTRHAKRRLTHLAAY